jgi:hypothetical protein
MKRRGNPEDGYMYGSAITLIAVAVLISLALFTLFILPSYQTGETAYSSLGVLTDDLALSGHVTGYGGLPVTRPNGTVLQIPNHPAGLASIQMGVRLATLRTSWEPGTGDDLSKATVVITTPGKTETLPLQAAGPGNPPGWIIYKKTGFLPGSAANDNTILEPNEVFTIIASPSNPLPPGTPFFVTVTVPDARPLTVSRTVPRTLAPVMDLG